ncbi:MAG: hypothetical protein WAO35_02470, partial [Terriglobia bacterium]
VLVERLAYAVGALAALGLGVWQWPRIADWLHHARSLASMPGLAAMPEYASSGDWLHLLAQPWPGQIPAFLLAASAAAFLTLIAFAAYVVWRED